MNKQEQRSELQERIAAELREKAKRTALQDDALVDGVEDAQYLDGTKQTTSLAWVWLLILCMAVAVVAMLLMM